MKTLKGKSFIRGRAWGQAIVSRMPLNLTASFSSLVNYVPGRGSEIRDRHHDLFGKKIKNKVLVIPTTVGSTYNGLVLLDHLYEKNAPCAMIVHKADSIMISGAILAEVWFNIRLPIIEVDSDRLFDEIATGDLVEVNGDTGEIRINPGEIDE